MIECDLYRFFGTVLPPIYAYSVHAIHVPDHALQLIDKLADSFLNAFAATYGYRASLCLILSSYAPVNSMYSVEHGGVIVLRYLTTSNLLAYHKFNTVCIRICIHSHYYCSVY